ncbi:MAG: copper-binding protein [Acidobacteriota bacterium]
MGWAALSLLLLATLGCGAAPDPESGAESSATTYETRGIIRQLPSGAPGSELFIHHEPIPEFVSIDGEVVGMESMTMGFPVADADTLTGFTVGDRVAFTLRVDFDGSPPLAIDGLRALPDGETLSFESADAPQGEGDGHADPSGHGGHGHHGGDGDPGGQDAPPEELGSADEHPGHGAPDGHGATDDAEHTPAADSAAG